MQTAWNFFLFLSFYNIIITADWYVNLKDSHFANLVEIFLDFQKSTRRYRF